MADTISEVTNLDIQLIDADRSSATTIKLDNPKSNITREQVSAAFQTAFSNGWFLCNNGKPAMYIGDVTVNQSIKRKLDGEDFYITPSSLTLTNNGTTAYGHVDVSGATIQGYNIKNKSQAWKIMNVNINSTALSISINISDPDGAPIEAGTFTLVLVIQGELIEVPCTVPEQQ